MKQRLKKFRKNFRNRFKIENDEISKGANSSIYLAKDIKDPKNPIKCVCKIVRASKKVSQKTFDKLRQEPLMLECLNHPNIIKVLGQYEESSPDCDCLLMWQELLCEDLEKYIDRVKIVDQNKWFIMSKLLRFNFSSCN